MVLLRKHHDFNFKCSSRIALGPILGLPSTSLGLFLANFGGPFGSVSSPVCVYRSPCMEKLFFAIVCTPPIYTSIGFYGKNVFGCFHIFFLQNQCFRVPAELFARSALTSCEFASALMPRWCITAELLSAWIVAIMCPG